MKEIAEFMMKQKQKVKCEKCGKEFEYSVIDDIYVYLPTGNCRICCPHCKTEYNYCVRLTKVKELENKNKIFAYMGKPVDALTYIEKKIEYERKKLENNT